MMIKFGYECDTCLDNHLATFEDLQDASWFLNLWASNGMKTWRVSE